MMSMLPIAFVLANPLGVAAVAPPSSQPELAAAVEAAAAAPSAAPEEEVGPYRNLYHRFTVSVGGAIYDNFSSTGQVSGDAGIGTIIDFEDLLNVDGDTQIGRVDMRYAFNERHWLDATYYDIRRSGTSAATSEDIDFGDITIPAGSRVSTDFDTRMLKLAYRYNFVTDDRVVIGGSFGIHSMNLRLALEAGGLGLDESFRQELPLPLLGLHGGYALSRKWALLADAELLQFDVGDYRGFVSDNRLSLEHDTLEHLGWGLALNGFRIDGSAEGDGGLEADIEYGYSGVMLYLRVYF
jgi:hypothetical protein